MFVARSIVLALLLAAPPLAHLGTGPAPVLAEVGTSPALPQAHAASGMAPTAPAGPDAGLAGAAAPAQWPTISAPRRISYQGQLTDANGEVLDGLHEFTFQFWDVAAGGDQLGNDVLVPGVPVRDGVFSLELDMPQAAYFGQDLWLTIGVDGEWLGPRQHVLAAPYALTLVPGAAVSGLLPGGAVLSLHNQSSEASTFGLIASTGVLLADLPRERSGVLALGPDVGVMGISTGDPGVGGAFTGATGVQATGGAGGGGRFDSAEGNGVTALSTSGHGVHAASTEDVAVYATAGTVPAMLYNGHHGVVAVGQEDGVLAWGGEIGGLFQGSTGVHGIGGTEAGGYFTSNAGVGVSAFSESEVAIQAVSHGNPAVYAVSGKQPVATFQDTACAVWADGAHGGVVGSGGAFGVEGDSLSGNGVRAVGAGSGAEAAALRVNNPNVSHGMAAYLTNNSDYATGHLDNTGSGEVLVLQSTGGPFLRAVDRSWDAKFRLEGNGDGYADGAWKGGGADYAELLPGAPGLEPGDVLAIDADGLLVRAGQAYQASVAGVYSSRPGFVAGQPIDGIAANTVPLAIGGVVPVKATAEGGPIRPGDLLVTSATPGRAMRAGANPPVGTVIGKALERLDAGTGIVRMLAMLQ